MWEQLPSLSPNIRKFAKFKGQLGHTQKKISTNLGTAAQFKP